MLLIQKGKPVTVLCDRCHQPVGEYGGEVCSLCLKLAKQERRELHQAAREFYEWTMAYHRRIRAQRAG